MKKSKSSRTLNSQIKYLNKRFYYHKNKDDIINSINLDDFDTTKDLFQFINKRYPFIKCGKCTKLFWTQNGYSEEEANDIKSKYSVKRDPRKSPMNIEYWTGKGFSKEESIFRIKSQRKMNLEYWISRGCSESDAIKKRSEYQLEQSLKNSLKRIKNPSRYSDIFQNQVGFWIKRGFTKKESMSIVSKRQNTFSLKKCIEKYGEEDGKIIWGKRQIKWMKSLKKSNYDGKSGKSFSISKKISQFGIDELIDSLSIKNKDLYKKLFRECPNIESFVDKYMDFIKSNSSTDEISIYRILRQILNLKVIYSFYNVNRSDIMSLIIPKIARIKTTYSNISWFNNHICRSDCEYIIANFLFRNDLNYEYEKRYPNSKMKCDFFLSDYGVYIEYLGMKKKSYTTKIDFLNRNGIKFIASSDIDELKNLIVKYANTQNKGFI